MPNTNYLRFRIGNRDIEVEDIDDVPVSIDYALEDPENFEQKKSSEAFNITLPATRNNSQSYNSPAAPDVEDLTANDFFTNHQPCVIEANGVEILKGKAFLVEATHTDRPEKMTVNCYGNNADWLIDLKESTIADFLNPASHTFNAATIQSSWAFNGQSETADFVYAPVRYRRPFIDSDKAVDPFALKPALSIYWMLYRALKSEGYRIASQFMDSEYFRRQVMPWTWGDFLYTDDTVQKPYLFKRVCTSQEEVSLLGGNWNEYISPNGSAYNNAAMTNHIQWNDVTSLAAGTAGGGFEGTSGLSSWNPPHQLTYTYPASSPLGYITAGFEIGIYYYVYISAGTHSWGLYAEWLINGVLQSTDLLYQYNGSGVSTGTAYQVKELNVNPGDTVTCRLKISAGTPGSHAWNWKVGNTVATSTSNGEPPSFFRMAYFKKALGSPVRLQDYPTFKKYKWLDLLRGVIDAFNLSIQTDPVNKVVYIEPTHDYYTGSSVAAKQPGYLGQGTLDWRQKQDLSRESTLQLYSDNEREFDFKFKDDSNDGGKNILAKRAAVEVGSSRYLFPDRFKTGNKDYTNRFFTPVVHVTFSNWKGLTSVTPQLIALIPENISNTSKDSDVTNFEPKLAYYKGNVSGAGGWWWQPDPNDTGTRQTLSNLPYMFAVNYQTGGQNDPVLTYCDQAIGSAGSTQLRAHGLMRRFFLQRLAIMRHGRLYHTWMKLSMRDITNWLHREFLIIGGKRYFLIGIDKYLPLRDETTQCTLWQWHPISATDDAAVLPSNDSVMATGAALASSDLKYAQSFILTTDLPQ